MSLLAHFQNQSTSSLCTCSFSSLVASSFLFSPIFFFAQSLRDRNSDSSCVPFASVRFAAENEARLVEEHRSSAIAAHNNNNNKRNNNFCVRVCVCCPMPPSSTNQHWIIADTHTDTRSIELCNDVFIRWTFQRSILISLMCRTPYLFVFIFTPLRSPTPCELCVCLFFPFFFAQQSDYIAIVQWQLQPKFSLFSFFVSLLFACGLLASFVGSSWWMAMASVLFRAYTAQFTHTHTQKEKEMAQTDRRSSARGSRLWSILPSLSLHAQATQSNAKEGGNTRFVTTINASPFLEERRRNIQSISSRCFSFFLFTQKKNAVFLKWQKIKTKI